jgi:hypothetical protein
LVFCRGRVNFAEVTPGLKKVFFEEFVKRGFLPIFGCSTAWEQEFQGVEHVWTLCVSDTLQLTIISINIPEGQKSKQANEIKKINSNILQIAKNIYV